MHIHTFIRLIDDTTQKKNEKETNLFTQTLAGAEPLLRFVFAFLLFAYKVSEWVQWVEQGNYRFSHLSTKFTYFERQKFFIAVKKPFENVKKKFMVN